MRSPTGNKLIASSDAKSPLSPGKGHQRSKSDATGNNDHSGCQCEDVMKLKILPEQFYTVEHGYHCRVQDEPDHLETHRTQRSSAEPGCIPICRQWSGAQAQRGNRRGYNTFIHGRPDHRPRLRQWLQVKNSIFHTLPITCSVFLTRNQRKSDFVILSVENVSSSSHKFIGQNRPAGARAWELSTK